MLKSFDPATYPDWRYPLRVAAALRAGGWPTPEPAEDPVVTADGAWVLFHRLPGCPVCTGGAEGPAGQRARGGLLAELHAVAAATGITGQRHGFTAPERVVGNPELGRWLRVHERADPVAARTLLACRDAALRWFADHPGPAVPRSVIHGDFAPWNLLFPSLRWQVEHARRHSPLLSERAGELDPRLGSW